VLSNNCLDTLQIRASVISRKYSENVEIDGFWDMSLQGLTMLS
jgi:hypothetical protein